MYIRSKFNKEVDLQTAMVVCNGCFLGCHSKVHLCFIFQTGLTKQGHKSCLVISLLVLHAWLFFFVDELQQYR